MPRGQYPRKKRVKDEPVPRDEIKGLEDAVNRLEKENAKLRVEIEIIHEVYARLLGMN